MIVLTSLSIKLFLLAQGVLGKPKANIDSGQQIISKFTSLDAVNPCGPSFKGVVSSSGDKKCIQLSNLDILQAINWMASPPKTSYECRNFTRVQGIDVCEDLIPQGSSGRNCHVWSMVSSNLCDHFGSLEFEKYWSSRGCKVTLFHFTTLSKNTCNNDEYINAIPNLKLIRGDIWGGRCYNCWYKLIDTIAEIPEIIDLVKVQSREGVREDFDGVQFTTLSDLFLYRSSLAAKMKQIVFTGISLHLHDID